MGRFGDANDITDIAKNADNLVLSFEPERGGGVIDVVLTLTLDGDMINATMEFAGGQLSIRGPARSSRATGFTDSQGDHFGGYGSRGWPVVRLRPGIPLLHTDPSLLNSPQQHLTCRVRILECIVMLKRDPEILSDVVELVTSP